MQRLRAASLHLLGEIEQHGDGAQGPENAADPQRVGDGLPQTEGFRHLEIGNCAGPIAPHLDHVEHIIRLVQRLPDILGGQHLGRHRQGIADAAGDDVRDAQPLRIYIVQPYLAAGECGVQQDVAEQVFGEHGAARPQKRDVRRACRPPARRGLRGGLPREPGLGFGGQVPIFRQRLEDLAGGGLIHLL